MARRTIAARRGQPRAVGRQRSNLRSIARSICVIAMPAAAMMMIPTISLSV
jgi:hypothetical protein